MRNKLILTTIFILFTAFLIQAQEPVKTEISNDSLNKSIHSLKKDLDVLKRLKINGWVQAQYQYADTVGALNFDGGDLPANVDQRFMIRRGRIKFTYDHTNVQYVVQLNMTERFVNIADIFAKITDPWTKWVSLQVGVMNRPFGYDIHLSSADRESPERARYTQIITPNERDMGAEIIIEAPKKSKFHGLRFAGGLFNGTGLTIPAVNISDIDSKKDFIGRLSYYSSTKDEKIKFGIGASNYYGYERMANNIYYYTAVGVNPLGDKEYAAADTSTILYKGKYAKRIYYGVEGLFSVRSPLGTTTLRGEYCFGQQPGSRSSTRSPQAATTGETYLRNFSGFYGYFIQRIGKSKHELVLKYEWYDPNADVAGDEIRANYKFTAADVKYTAIGLGYNCYINDNYKLMLHYNMVTNELSNNLSGFTREIPDNILTIRVQARF
jgi:phosphate-selective porin